MVDIPYSCLVVDHNMVISTYIYGNKKLLILANHPDFLRVNMVIICLYLWL